MWSPENYRFEPDTEGVRMSTWARLAAVRKIAELRGTVRNLSPACGRPGILAVVQGMRTPGAEARSPSPTARATSGYGAIDEIEWEGSNQAKCEHRAGRLLGPDRTIDWEGVGRAAAAMIPG